MPRTFGPLPTHTPRTVTRYWFVYTGVYRVHTYVATARITLYRTRRATTCRGGHTRLLLLRFTVYDCYTTHCLPGLLLPTTAATRTHRAFTFVPRVATAVTLPHHGRLDYSLPFVVSHGYMDCTTLRYVLVACLCRHAFHYLPVLPVVDLTFTTTAIYRCYLRLLRFAVCRPFTFPHYGWLPVPVVVYYVRVYGLLFHRLRTWNHVPVALVR